MTRIAFTNVRIFDGSGEEPYAGDLLVEENASSRWRAFHSA